jgi:nucleotide-binding universal stress UspA family protein
MISEERIIMYKTILVALDGSEAADHALQSALDLASKYSANLVLVSVVHYVPVPLWSYPLGASGVPSGIAGSYYTELKTNHEKILKEAQKQAQKLQPTLEVTTKLVEGRPSDMIVKIAKTNPVNLIVIGHRGLGGIKGFFLGSVSNRVADEAECPVLIVK